MRLLKASIVTDTIRGVQGLARQVGLLLDAGIRVRLRKASTGAILHPNAIEKLPLKQRCPGTHSNVDWCCFRKRELPKHVRLAQSSTPTTPEDAPASQARLLWAATLEAGVKIPHRKMLVSVPILEHGCSLSMLKTWLAPRSRHAWLTLWLLVVAALPRCFTSHTRWFS